MRISDWSSDVCSSDPRPASNFKNEAVDRRVDDAGAIDIGKAERLNPLIAMTCDLHKRKLPLHIGAVLSKVRHPMDGHQPFKLRYDLIYDPGGAIGDNGDTARSEEHTSEIQSLMRISYAVFCLK